VKRETFSSGLAVFFATLGSAVGLGNIWKFPYLTGQYGGGAFLAVYFLCILFVGLPIMVSEFYIGRKTRKNAVGALEELKPGTGWKYIGIMGALSSYLIMFFYSCVAGWVYFYLFKAIKGDFAGITMANAQSSIPIRGCDYGASFAHCLAVYCYGRCCYHSGNGSKRRYRKNHQNVNAAIICADYYLC